MNRLVEADGTIVIQRVARIGSDTQEDPSWESYPPLDETVTQLA